MRAFQQVRVDTEARSQNVVGYENGVRALRYRTGEERELPRANKRLMVRYGQKEAEVVGFDFRTEEHPPRLVRQVGTVLLSLKKLPDEPIPLEAMDAARVGDVDVPREHRDRKNRRRMVHLPPDLLQVHAVGDGPPAMLRRLAEE